MKTREEVARFIEAQLKDEAPPVAREAGWHYGKCRLRQLMDFIYEGPPQSEQEKLGQPLRLRNAKVGKWRDDVKPLPLDGVIDCMGDAGKPHG